MAQVYAQVHIEAQTNQSMSKCLQGGRTGIPSPTRHSNETAPEDIAVSS